MQIFWYQDELVTEVNKLRIVLETYKKDGNKIDLTNDDQFETEFPFLHKLCSPANVKTKLNFLTHLPFIHFFVQSKNVYCDEYTFKIESDEDVISFFVKNENDEDQVESVIKFLSNYLMEVEITSQDFNMKYSASTSSLYSKRHKIGRILKPIFGS